MEQNIKKQRNSSIELLRIIAMIGAIILHYNNSGMGGGFKLVEAGSLNQRYIFFSETLFICAVNLFVMISAYFLSRTQKRKTSKVLTLILQVVIFKVAAYIITLVRGGDFSGSSLLRALLPANYFVILYSVTYILSPYINIAIKNVTQKQFRNFVIITFILFSCWNFFVDFLNMIFGGFNGLSTISLHGPGRGYTITNFIMVYIIGAYIGLTDIKITKKQSLSAVVLCMTLLYIEVLFEQLSFASTISWNYNHPLVVLLPVFLIILFSNIKFQSKIINELSKATFTCYLFHGYLLKHIGVGHFVNGNIFVLILHQFGSAIAIYLLSYLVYKIYNFLFTPIIKPLSKLADKCNISLE